MLPRDAIRAKEANNEARTAYSFTAGVRRQRTFLTCPANRRDRPHNGRSNSRQQRGVVPDTVEKVTIEWMNVRLTQSRFNHAGDAIMLLRNLLLSRQKNFARVLMTNFFDGIAPCRPFAEPVRRGYDDTLG